MNAPAALEPGQLCWRCDPAELGFESTAELEPLDATYGQERAIEAIELGLAAPHKGYNIYALGPDGIGKHTLIRHLLEQHAQSRPAPFDWCHVSNFAEERKPKVLRLPNGAGARLRDDMTRFVEDVATSLKNAFENEDYRNRRQALEEELKEHQEQAVSEVEAKARERGIALVRSHMGFGFAPMRDGQIIKPEVFHALDDAERKRIEADIEELQKELQNALQKLPVWQKETRAKIRELNQETAAFAVGFLIDSLKETYAGIEAVHAFLDQVRNDIIEQVEAILQSLQESEKAAADSQHPIFRRYRVNLLVDHGDLDHAPVVYEDDPTHERLIGRVDHRAQMGTLVTDFHMIRGGALHRANGGYLLVDARAVLTKPMAFEALKRALTAGRVRIESPMQSMGLLSTETVEPEPVPLDVKVVLVGERLIYHLLSALDPTFARLFKIAADFEDQIDRSGEAQHAFARMIAGITRDDDLAPLGREAVAVCLEHLARHAGDGDKLSTSVELLADLVREADHYRTTNGGERVEAEAVRQAIAQRRRRLGRIRELSEEQILKGTVAIATEGAAVGQINGLAVTQFGGIMFGRPSRISARVRIGAGQVVDIEREARLGGPLHSKGVLILSSYLAGHYAADVPLSLRASLVFEQSYGGVDGDSASAAELIALLSAIAEVPIKQGFAITGSVNQWGDVQAIGGVNEKIEGFFDICQKRGLDGSQGVLIPAANQRHLILERRVVEAVESGRFHVYPLGRIDEALTLLTGVPAGARGADGRFEPGSVNARVEERLRELARQRRAFGAHGDGGAGGDGSDKEASDDGG